MVPVHQIAGPTKLSGRMRPCCDKIRRLTKKRTAGLRHAALMKADQRASWVKKSRNIERSVRMADSVNLASCRRTDLLYVQQSASHNCTTRTRIERSV